MPAYLCNVYRRIQYRILKARSSFLKKYINKIIKKKNKDKYQRKKLIFYSSVNPLLSHTIIHKSMESFNYIAGDKFQK